MAHKRRAPADVSAAGTRYTAGIFVQFLLGLVTPLSPHSTVLHEKCTDHMHVLIQSFSHRHPEGKQ